MLAIVFYDRKIDSLFSWPVGSPRILLIMEQQEASCPRSLQTEAVEIQSSPAPVPCPLPLATGRWSGAHRVGLPLCVYCQLGTCGISDHYELNKVILPEELVSDRGSESLWSCMGRCCQVSPGSSSPWAAPG